MDWKLKLKALLHDPPYKACVLREHEEKAEELLNYILPDERIKDRDVEDADQLASAQSRIIVKPNFQGEQKKGNFESASQVNYEECFFIDIFSKKKEDIQSPDEGKVKDLFKKLRSLDFRDQEERAKFIFLFLWRFYPEIFPEINKHPADTRAPNHSIYDHLVQTSAIVSALPKPAFLLFTIGPVQSFISKSRKTSDLWAGSYMLSYLIWESMKPLVEELGPDVIIFPNLLGQPLLDRWLCEEKFEVRTNSETFKNILNNIFKDEEWFKKFVDNAYLEEKLTIANLPNRFLAVIPYDNGKNLAQYCEGIFKSKLKYLAQKVNEKVKSYSQNSNLENDIEKHLLSYFQVYWVILPWVSNPEITDLGIIYSPRDALNDYKELFGESELYETVKGIVEHPYYTPANVGSAYSLLLEIIEKLLGARKSIRDFKQIEQPGEKCHLCGEYEVLSLNWSDLEEKKPGLIRKKEKLCGVCLTKRLFPEILKEELNLSDEVKFPSTSEMASIGEKRRLDNNIKTEFQQTIGEKFLPSISVPKLRNDPLYKIDGEYLMKETYREEYFEKEYGIQVNEGDFQNILKFLEDNKINPSKYYAILQMDSDNMGKWLKGEFNPKIKDTIHQKVKDALIQFSEGEDKEKLLKILCSKHPTSPSIHQVFSRRLSAFALEHVRKIVEDDYYGKLVYAGGDDVLVFLPIEEVLNCAYDLQRTFKDVLSSNASMSAGILIVHHKYPLYLALRKVNEAEKRAKIVYGKNGFCLVFLAHSGEERECGGAWKLIHFINDLICKFKKDEIPDVFPYQYLEVVEKLYEKEKSKNLPNIKEILKNELERIFMRKEGDKEKLKDYFKEKILPCFDKIDVENFANLLVIANKISKEVRIRNLGQT